MQLPDEIWCTIISYLDIRNIKKLRKSHIKFVALTNKIASICKNATTIQCFAKNGVFFDDIKLMDFTVSMIDEIIHNKKKNIQSPYLMYVILFRQLSQNICSSIFAQDKLSFLLAKRLCECTNQSCVTIKRDRTITTQDCIVWNFTTSKTIDDPFTLYFLSTCNLVPFFDVQCVHNSKKKCRQIKSLLLNSFAIDNTLGQIMTEYLDACTIKPKICITKNKKFLVIDTDRILFDDSGYIISALLCPLDTKKVTVYLISKNKGLSHALIRWKLLFRLLNERFDLFHTIGRFLRSSDFRKTKKKLLHEYESMSLEEQIRAFTC